MFDENISHKEDKENLMYIYKQINLQQSLNEDISERGSIASVESAVPNKHLESEANLHNFVNIQGPESFTDPELIAKTKPFGFTWTYGINAKSTINLTTEYRKDIFFASSHVPIIYNYCSKQMKCLEGHQHLITSISVDQSGHWLATADDGKDGCVIIWDSYELKPVYTLFGLYSLSGTILVKLSGSARYLLTVGVRKEGNYSLDMWLWTYGNDEPDDSFEIDKSFGNPIEVCFNPNVEEFIMVILKRQVIFLIWDAEEKKFTKSKMPRITHPNKTGTLTTGCYANDCHECFACSTKGCVLIFGSTLYCKPFEEGELDNSKIYINAIKISDHAVRSCAAITSGLVIGDASGSILFFDTTIRILYWFRNFNVAPIISISFNSMPKMKHEDLLAIYTVKPSDSHIFECDFVDLTGELQRILRTNLPTEASLKNEPLLLPDFFIGTSDNNIYAVDFLNNKYFPIFLKADDNVTVIEVHDELPYLVIGYANGRIHLVDYEKNDVVCSTMLPKSEDSAPISALKYSDESIHLVCGRENGEIWILEPILLEPKVLTPFLPSKNKVVKIVFSRNIVQFAYYDNNKTVVLFVYDTQSCEWKFTGKLRSHYETINDIIFMPYHHTSILYTIGNDRHIVEYNNNRAREQGLSIVCRERIEQRAIPMSFIYWQEDVRDKTVGYLLIADNEHKFKLLDVETKIPKSVFLAPAYGCFRKQIISKMKIIPNTEAKYMVFSSSKFMGLHRVLPDGNPYSYVGYLGHPATVVDLLLSPDGKHLFSFGKEDHCVFKWNIKIKAVELMHLLGGKELEPYYCLIEGGKNGWLFQEIKDLFYYMQILQHDSVDYPRRVSDSINITELPELVRTCGFYPSEYELENMMIDVKYKNYNETGELNTEINFIDFVKLFCNHKPAYGYTKERIKRAFDVIMLRSESESDTSLSREQFASALAYSGEHISPCNLLKLLKALMRSDDADDDLGFLPEEITFEFLYKEIFGIDSVRATVMEHNEPEEDIFSPRVEILE